MLKVGIIAFNNGRSTLSCQVRNLSETGALILINRAIDVPEKFDLLIPLDGFQASCQVIWRKVSEVGVRFLAVPRSVAPKRSQMIERVGSTLKASLHRQPDKT